MEVWKEREEWLEKTATEIQERVDRAIVGRGLPAMTLEGRVVVDEFKRLAWVELLPSKSHDCDAA